MAMDTIDDSFDREKSVYIAKVAEEAERYQDMVIQMKRVVNMGEELTAEERNLLSTAFKKLVDSRRASLKKLRATTDIFTDVVSMDRMNRFQMNVKREMEDICRDFLTILDENLIPTCQEEDYTAFVFYLKMKGDYYRYLAEITIPDRRDVAELSIEAYGTAGIIARAELPPTHPVRLGLALSLSVYYYRIEGLPKRAAEIANAAFNEANSGLDSLNEEADKDSTQIMKLLRDNITYWEREITGQRANLNEGGIASI